MAAPKYFVSYFVLGGYVAAIFAISLIIALTSSLANVKRTNCENPNSKSLANANLNKIEEIKSEPLIKKEQVIQQNRHNSKRNINDDEYAEKMKILKQYEHLKDANVKEVPTCGSLFQTSTNGTLWESERLPKNVLPTHYVVEFFSPYFSFGIYNGQVEIYLDITENVNTIIIHSHLINVFLPFLHDNTNTLIDLQCADYFKYYEYFVIRTQNMISRSQAPLKLTLQFDGFLNIYESGIFSLSYAAPGTEFNGYFNASSF